MWYTQTMDFILPYGTCRKTDRNGNHYVQRNKADSEKTNTTSFLTYVESTFKYVCVGHESRKNSLRREEQMRKARVLESMRQGSKRETIREEEGSARDTGLEEGI